MTTPGGARINSDLQTWWSAVLAPVAAALLVLFAALLGIVALLAPVQASIAIPGPPAPVGTVLGITFWTVMVYAAGTRSIITRSGSQLSLAAVPTVAAAILGGPLAACWVAVVGSLELREIRRGRPMQLVWNHLSIGLPITVAALLIQPLQPLTASDAPLGTLISFVASTLVGVAYLSGNMWMALWGNARFDRRRVMRLIRANLRGVLTLASLVPVGWLLAEVYVRVAWWSVLAVGGVLLSWHYAVRQDETNQRLSEDHLTGLLNRHGIEDALRAALRRGVSSHRTTAIFFIDLDRFKPVNDQLGHDAGDALLVEIGKRLASVLRPGDAVGRLGGDEFCVVADNMSADTAAGLAGRLRAAVAEPWDWSGTEVSVTASVGFAISAGDGGDVEGLLRCADQAMYADKTRDPKVPLQASGAGRSPQPNRRKKPSSRPPG